MKKNITFALLLSSLTLFGQAKKYALVEHFTNTNCSVCASQNPSFYTRVSIETNTDLHHISYHWRTPYTACAYYQVNTVPQDTRADYYGVPGSPRASLNGATQTSLTNITTAAITAAATTSSLSISLKETTGTARTATVKVKTTATIPVGTYKLYAALVEKKTNYAGPNGETTHHNVFRAFLTAADGNAITPSATEQTLSFNYNPADISSAVAAQLYVVTWVQNATTKEVINSATRFDPQTTATKEASIEAQVAVSPNPTTGKVNVTFEKVTPQYLTVCNINGQVLETVKDVKSTSYELNFYNYVAGVYFIKVKSAEGVAIKRIVKE